MLTQLSKIGILDKANNSVAVLSNIMDGTDGSASIGYTITPNEIKIEDGQTLTSSVSHLLDLRVLSNAIDKNVLITASQEAHPVRVTAIGVDGFLVIDSDSHLIYSEGYDGIISDRCLITAKSVSGYAGTPPNSKKQWYAGSNLLSVYNVLGGSASLLNGFDVESGLTASVSGATQTLTRTSGSTFAKTKMLFFPFENVQLTVSMFVLSANASYTYGFRCLNIAGSSIGDVVLSSSATASRVTMTGSTLAGTRYVQFIVRPGTASSNNVVFQQPAIQLNNKVSFDL